MPHSRRDLVFLALVAVLGATLTFLSVPASVRAAWSTASYSSADEDLMLQLINQARASYGLKALTMDSTVRGVAEWRSSDMSTKSYFGHLIPTSCDTVFPYLDAAGVKYSWAAENIGWNTYSDDQATQWMFNSFMNSSVHRANILDSRATALGIGAYKYDWKFGSACGQTGDGSTYTGNHMYALVFIQAADTTPPTVSAPISRLYPSTLGSSTVRVRTSWSASDASGIKSYTVQRSVNGGSWYTQTLSSATATSIAQSLTFGYSYRYRVRATDTKGNTSAFVYGPTFKPAVTQQSSTSVAYGGTWFSVSNSYASGGSYRYTSSAGAWASFTFSGASIGWVGIRSPYGGSADIYVDGVYKTTVSLYASTTAWRPIVYTLNWSSQATHTIKLVAKGNGRVYLDAFARLLRV